MEKHHFSIIFAAVLAALLALSSCSSLDALTVTSCSIASVLPAEEGFDVGIAIDETNSGARIKLSDIEGSIYAQDSRIATFTTDDVIIPAKCKSSCTLNVHLTPDPGKTILSLLKLRRLSAEDFTADVQARVKVGCLPAARMSKEGINASYFIDRL